MTRVESQEQLRHDDSRIDGRQHLLALLEGEIDQALESLDGHAPLMRIMAQYHLGLSTSSGEPTDPATRLTVQGKRIRPLIAMLTAEAVGGTARDAAPIAAAIELLHNFTLIHDDIQDRSPNRRHRPTVWRVWGDAQAINAGDALFAASQLTALRTSAGDDKAGTIRCLLDAFNRCTIEIVRGQVLDIENEGRPDVTSDDYLTMIGGKTAAILRFAAWAGATVGGASDDVADKLGEVGEAIGMGFQIRDDMLGIWSPATETGKDAADDIRRRKQSLPILILRESASAEDRKGIATLYQQEEIGPDGTAEILAMLEKYDVAAKTMAHVDAAHERANRALSEALPNHDAPAVRTLAALITQLQARTS
jgi:geranylgeranyl diphosphate synthase, type I